MTDAEEEESPSPPSPPPRLTLHRNRLWRRIPRPAPVQPSETTRAAPTPVQNGDSARAHSGMTAAPTRAFEQPERVEPAAGPSRRPKKAQLAGRAKANEDAPGCARPRAESSRTSLTGFEAQPGPAPKLPKTADGAAANRYKTPARQLGPPPDGKWAASTLRKLAAEASRHGSAERDDASSSDEDDEEVEQLDELLGSVQQVYATLIPRTASKMLARSYSKRTQSTRSRQSRAEVPNLSDDEAAKGAFASASRAKDDSRPEQPSSPANAPAPTHHFAGSRSVSKLSAKAKSQYLRRTATGRRIPLDMEDFVAPVNQPIHLNSDDDDEEEDGEEEASYEGDSDDLYDPGPPGKAGAKTGKGKKRPRKWVDTPATGAVKRLKVGAAARGNFLGQVKETGFSPLLAKTPKSAPSRMRSISVIEKSIDRSNVKKRAQQSDEQQRGRRIRSLAMVPAEEAGAVAELPAPPVLDLYVPNGVMPDDLPPPPPQPAKAFSARKKPGQKRFGTKSRFRYVPARLPPPRRLASLRAAQAATKENLGGPATDAQLEKVQGTNVRAVGESRFRFATGPGAKRAPTVMYGFPSSPAFEREDEERRSPESPIRSDHSAAPFGYSDVEPCDDAPQLPASGGMDDGAAASATTGGAQQSAALAADVAAADDARDAAASRPTAPRLPLTAENMSDKPAVLAPPTSQDQLEEGAASTADQARVSLPLIVPDSQSAPSLELSLPVPAGKRILLPGYSFSGRDSNEPISPELRAETSSSASSGIWSRLPTQFDHRFVNVAASGALTDQNLEVPSTASLLDAAYADADEPLYPFEPPYQSYYPALGRAGQSLPASVEL